MLQLNKSNDEIHCFQHCFSVSINKTSQVKRFISFPNKRSCCLLLDDVQVFLRKK